MTTRTRNLDPIEPPRLTPWGDQKYPELRAPGIWQVSTPSHGGIYLAPWRVAEIPAGHQQAIKAITWLGKVAWYEEDCDALIPLVYFRVQRFSWGAWEYFLDHARERIRNDHPFLVTMARAYAHTATFGPITYHPADPNHAV